MTSSTQGFRPPEAKLKKPRWRTNFFLSIMILVILIVGLTAWSTDNYLWRLSSPHDKSHPRAIVMDELSLNYPDPSFNTNITNALKNAGFAVDYSGPSPTSVDSFRQLPRQGYDLVIIRAHTGSSQSIITTEPYSQSKYVTDQLAGRLVPAQIEGGPVYFAITPKFVRQEMAGSFSESTIIVMGCSALEGTQDIATAFLDKGASFFVGWNSAVSIIHTDTSTVTLVQQLLAGSSLPEATARASVADPVYGARLQYLDWNSLVQSRVNSLITRLAVWVALATVLLIGPMAVFVAPRIFASLDHIRERVTIDREKKTGHQQRHDSLKTHND